ncbi:MAG TPA: tetratricopeptide repeat protein [Candidatus Sulfotelmatobacter sp.]|nr:tetratricopeptide repeat protein [Candidatus Sulfotelmatobacter sp.]
MSFRIPRALFITLFCATVLLPSCVWAQNALRAASSQQGLYLVFPFENNGSAPRLDWLGEGLEELTIQYLSDSGEQVYSHAGRAGELERYGLPTSAKLSRATMLRIAQDLDADYVIFGSFYSDGTSLTVESHLLRVDPPALISPVSETGPLTSLMDMQAKVVWHTLVANDKSYPLALPEFSKSLRPLRLDAFEHFVRGLLATDDEPRLRELREAARLDPAWPDPAFALGETYAGRGDCNSALPWFGRIPKTHSRYLEANFAIGVCRLQLNQPDKAEEVFVALQSSIRGGSDGPGTNRAVSGADLPEILNNLGLALAREGKMSDAQGNFKHAVELDPDEDDYPFNLGLLAFRANDFNAAAAAFREAVDREPDNAEDRALLIQSLDRAGKKAEAEEERNTVAEALGPNALPTVHVDAKSDAQSHLDRLKTDLDVTALRLEILSSAAPSGPVSTNSDSASASTPASHIRQGRQELAGGRLELAEAQFRAALAADPANASAHLGLAEVNRRRYKFDDAITELQASLKSRDSAVVRTTLARIYMEQKKFALARGEAEKALALAPNYTEAKQLLDHLQNPKSAGSPQSQ